MKSFDFVIIGSGAAAMAAALKANELGVKTALIEKKEIVGGTCVNVGCVPTKHLIKLAEVYHQSHQPRFKALSGNGLRLDFQQAIQEKDLLVSSLRHNKYEDVLNSLSEVTFFKGKAKFSSPTEITVNGETIKGKKFLIATGSSPFIPPLKGLDQIKYLTNEEALTLSYLPKSLIVLGGGPLGLEFAQMFAHFGTKVCVVQRAKQLLPRIEPEVAQAITQYLLNDGVEICTGSEALNVRQEGKEIVLTAKVGEEIREYRGEEVLIATGRKPNSSDLGLEAIGVQLGKRGEVVINKLQQTSLPHIYAAGDVRGEPMLETTAAKEGTIVAENALTGTQNQIDYSLVPSCIFTTPEVAQVGLTDAQAIAKGYKCSCRSLSFSEVPKAQLIKDTRGIIKMVAEAETLRLLGVSICAPNAGDLIHEAALALRCGLTVKDLAETVHVFPTLSEAIKLVAVSYFQDVTKMPCCT